jgi:transposase InsO family protein
MREHKDQRSVRETSAVFGAPASACCKRAKRGASQRRSAEDAAPLGLIREIVQQHHFCYGSPRAREELRNACGKRVGLKKAARLTRENGLNARRRGKFIPATNSNRGPPVCENLLNREFQAETAGATWVSDITCLRVLEGWLCLTVALDLFDRKAIGRAFGDGMETVRAAIPALRMAFANRTAREVMAFHSDRRAQYRSHSFRDALSARRPTVRQSVSRKGNCRDNACAESFFKTLKRELEALDGGHAAAVARQSVFMYLEAYCNRLRLHSALDYRPPAMVYSGRLA